MANLFNALGNSQPMMNQSYQQPYNSYAQRFVQNGNPAQNFFESFKQFKQTFSGDPNQVIRQKLQSGEFTQNQLMQAQGMLKQAYEMQNLFGVNPNPNIRR